MHWQDDKPSAPEGIEKARKAKAWLDERGVPLTPAKLAALSSHWSPAEWEAYLEDAEVALREDLGQRKDRRVLLDEFEANEDGIDTSEHHPYETEHRYDLSDSVKPLTEVLRPAARTKIGDDEASEEIIPLDEQAMPMASAYEREERRNETRVRIIERALRTLALNRAQYRLNLVAADGHSQLSLRFHLFSSPKISDARRMILISFSETGMVSPGGVEGLKAFFTSVNAVAAHKSKIGIRESLGAMHDELMRWINEMARLGGVLAVRRAP